MNCSRIEQIVAKVEHPPPPKSLVLGRGMQGSWLPVIPFFLVHFAPVFTEVFVALNIQLHKVADFDWVDFSSAAVADLRQRHSVIKQ